MLTAQEIETKATDIAAAFKDGVQVSDLITVIPKFMEIVEGISDAKMAEGEDPTGAQKKQLAIDLINKFLDKVDLPGPDVIVNPFVKRFVPTIIDVICAASNGDFEINS